MKKPTILANHRSGGRARWLGAAFVGAVLAVTAAPQAQADLATGLVAYYPMDGNPKDTKGAAHGTSGDGSTLIYTAGKFGQGVDLDGAAQYIETPEAQEGVFDFGAPDTPTGFSVSTWFRVDGFSKNWQCLVAKGEGNRWRIHRRDAGDIFTGNGGNADVPAGETNVNDGKIHHLVLVSQADKVTLYIDGKVESEGGEPTLENNDQPMMIGENPDARNRTWDGLIDDLAFWKRPLTAVEVTQLFTSTVSLGSILNPPAQPIGTDLLAYWSFDGGATESVGGLKGELIEDAKIGTGKTGGGLDTGGDNTMAKLLIEDASAIGKKVFAKDQVTIAFWQKNTSDVRDQSAFWWDSESSGGGKRGIQGHTPWSNGRIYFDSVGCCTNPTQRLDESAGDLDFSVWNHFAFVKDKDKKKIYVNGTVLAEVEGADPLPDDLVILTIGCNSSSDGGARAVPGILDDFAIWASPLSEADIKKLAAGQAPLSGGATVVLAGLSGTKVTRELLTIEFTDAGTSKIDPASVKLTVDGKAATVEVTKVADKTTITHKPSPIFAHGSTHPYVVAAKDTNGADIGVTSEVKLPSPTFPEADLPGAAVVNGAFAVRYIWGTGTAVTGLANVVKIIQDANKAGFVGKKFDTTHAFLDHGPGGFLTENLEYPEQVTGDADWTGDDFIQYSVAHIKVTTAGEYTFGFHSDDGFAFRIKGATALSKSGAGTLDRADPNATLHPADTGDSNTRAVYNLPVGVYRLEFFWWERGGGDFGELYVAKGSFAADDATDTWKPIGDATAVVKLTNEAVTGGSTGGGDRPLLTGALLAGGKLGLTFTGGTGPFILQGSTDLKSWVDLESRADRTFSLPASGGGLAFFRVGDKSAKTVKRYSAVLSGAAERPTAVTTPAVGTAVLAVEGDKLTVIVTYSGLRAAATAAHLHGPAGVDAAAGVLIGLTAGSPLGTSGSFILNGATLTAAQKTALEGGQTYVNIHTSVNPGGEIRGQVTGQ